MPIANQMHVISVHTHGSLCTRSFVSLVIELNTFSRGLLMDRILHHFCLSCGGGLLRKQHTDHTQRRQVSTCVSSTSSHASPSPTPLIQCCVFFFVAPLWTHLAGAKCLSNRCAPILNLKVGGVSVLVVASAAFACPEQVVQNTVHQPSRKSMCYKEFALSRTVSPCAHAHFFVCKSTCTA